MAMKFATYYITSLMLMLGTVYYAYYTYRQFYPTVLFLVSSKVAYIFIGNLLFANALLVARIFKRLFFGQLRDTEVELLVDTAKYTIPETCLALTIFRNELTPVVITLFGTLIFIKLLHKLSKCRVEYMEQLLPMPIKSQLRAYFLFAVLFFIDIVGATLSVVYISKYGRSVLILFGFEFGLLVIYTLNITIRFIIQVLDSRSEAGLQSKGLYLMLTDMTCEIVKFLTYVCFFGLIFVYYGLPIHLLRDVYWAFVTCQRKVVSFIKYMQLTRNLDTRFEDATPEELAAAGNCLVCREDLAQGKKLRCGHVFHLDCLRMWLQHQQSCPLCRSNISTTDPTPAAAGAAGAAGEGAAGGVPPAGPPMAAAGGPGPAAAAAAAGAPGVVAAPAAQLAPNQPAVAAGPVAPATPAAAATQRHVSSTASTTSARQQPVHDANAPAVFGRTLNEDAPMKRALQTFPRFAVIVGEPDVAVLSDPMRTSSEIRRISSGTIVFVTARVQDGEGGRWLRAPDGWILERHPDHVSDLSGDSPLYSVVPLTGPASTGPSSTRPQVNTQTPTAVPAASVAASAPTRAVPAASLTAEVSQEELARSESPSRPESGFYSRRHNSRLLDLLDKKPAASPAQEKDNDLSPTGSQSDLRTTGRGGERAPFSATIDDSETEDGSPSRDKSGSKGESGASASEEIAECLRKLNRLLSAHEGNSDFEALRGVVSATVQRLPHSQRRAAPSADMIAMQTSMEQVARNLVELSQSVLDCQRALSTMTAKGDDK